LKATLAVATDALVTGAARGPRGTCPIIGSGGGFTTSRLGVRRRQAISSALSDTTGESPVAGFRLHDVIGALTLPGFSRFAGGFLGAVSRSIAGPLRCRATVVLAARPAPKRV